MFVKYSRILFFIFETFYKNRHIVIEVQKGCELNEYFYKRNKNATYNQGVYSPR